MSEFRSELQNRSELKCTFQARNPELAVVCLPIINLELFAGYVAGQKTGVGCGMGQKSGVGCSILFVSQIRSSRKYTVHVRSRELAAIYVSCQKSGEGCPELVVVCVSGQKSGVGCSIRFMSKIRRSLKYSF